MPYNDGYTMLMNSLRQLATDLENRNTQIDWGKLWNKITGKKPEETPGNAAATAGINAAFRGANLEPTARSQYSPDNPYIQYLPGENSVLKPTSKLIQALNDWEAQNKAAQQKAEEAAIDKDLERQLKIAQIKKMTAGETPFSYNPVSYIQGLSDKNPWKSYLNNPNNFTSQKDVADAFTKAVAWEEKNKQKLSSSSGGKEKTPYEKAVEQYKLYLSSRSQLAKIEDKPDFISWVRANYGEETARKFKAEAAGDPELANISTQTSKRGMQLRDFTPEGQKIDELIRNAKSIRKVTYDLMNDVAIRSTPKKLLEALGRRWFPDSKDPLTDLMTWWVQNKKNLAAQYGEKIPGVS